MARKTANSWRLGPPLLGCLIFAAESARAAEPTVAERAQQLFEEGRTLMKEERFAEACEKLAQSQTLDAGGGTLLNLGICRGLEGRTATAARLLRDALAQAHADARADRAATAERHLSELAPLLSRVTVRVAGGGSGDVAVALDGNPLPRDVWNSALELDPGAHRLTATEPAHASFELGFTLGAAEDRAVDVPALEPERSAEPTRAPLPARLGTAAPAHAAPLPRQAVAAPAVPRWFGYTLLGTGAAAVAAGSYFGVRALTLRADSDRHFDGARCTSQGCVSDWNSARTFAHLSDLGIGVGAVAVGAGIVVLLLPSNAPTRAPALALSLSAIPRGPGASLTGKF
jgi:hypothetical protein